MNAGFEDLTVLDKILRNFPDRSEAFAAYSKARCPDAYSICNLALYNYWEMSTAMTSRLFKLKRSFYGFLHKLAPSLLVPLYSMVSFTNIPYAQVIDRHKRQERFVNFILGMLGAGFFSTATLFTIRRLNA